MTINKKTLLGFLVAFAIGCFVQAASAEKQNLAQIYMFTAKGGHEAQMYQAIKEHAEWRKAEGDPWVWMVYQTVTGNEIGKFIIRSGSHGWSCFDAYADFLAKGSVEWNKNVAPHIASSQSIIMSDKEKLEDWPTEPGMANLLDITWYDLKPGKMGDFFEAAEMYHKAIQENDRDAHYAFSKVESGAPIDRIVLAIPFANYSAMAGLEEPLGDFFKRVMSEEDLMTAGEKWNTSYEYVESYIIQFHPELSVLPDPEE
jgi:hypothetical protein